RKGIADSMDGGVAGEFQPAGIDDVRYISSDRYSRRPPMAKNVICLWYNGTAEEAAKFYAQTFPNSTVTAVHRAPGDYPNGKQGQVLTVEFTVLGVPCLGLNGGP